MLIENPPITDVEKRTVLLLVAMLDGNEHYEEELENIILEKKIDLVHDQPSFYEFFGTNDNGLALGKAFSRLKNKLDVFTPDKIVKGSRVKYFQLDSLKISKIYEILLEITSKIKKIKRVMEEDSILQIGKVLREDVIIFSSKLLSFFMESPFFRSTMKVFVDDFKKMQLNLEEHKNDDKIVIDNREFFFDNRERVKKIEKIIEKMPENLMYFEAVIKIVQISPSALSRFLERLMFEYTYVKSKYNSVNGLMLPAYNFQDEYERLKVYLIGDYLDKDFIGNELLSSDQNAEIITSFKLGDLYFPASIENDATSNENQV